MTSQSAAGSNPTTATPPSGASAGGNFSKWADAVPKSVSLEDSVTPAENSRIWDALYKYAGHATGSEAEKRSIRAGVYVYCVLNGTSREGSYSGTIQIAGGATILASVIPRAASKMKIRKFLRANMAECYQCLKDTRAMEQYERFIASRARHGISPEDAFATADFLADCPDFTPSEVDAHNTMFAYSIDRSRRARGGKSLEDVEGGRVGDELAANGPAVVENTALTRW